MRMRARIGALRMLSARPAVELRVPVPPRRAPCPLRLTSQVTFRPLLLLRLRGYRADLLDRLGAQASLEGLGGLDVLTEGSEVRHGDPLFPRMQELPAIIAEALAKVGGDLKSLEGKAKPAKKRLFG